MHPPCTLPASDLQQPCSRPAPALHPSALHPRFTQPAPALRLTCAIPATTLHPRCTSRTRSAPTMYLPCTCPAPFPSLFVIGGRYTASSCGNASTRVVLVARHDCREPRRRDRRELSRWAHGAAVGASDGAAPRGVPAGALHLVRLVAGALRLYLTALHLVRATLSARYT